MMARRIVKVALVVIAIIAAIVLIPVALLLGTFALYDWFPAHSAETYVSEASTSVRIDLYAIPPYQLAEYYRHLHVTTPAGKLHKELQLDWGGATRTSLYLTPDRKLILLGPARDDYLISPEPLKIGDVPRLASDTWTYLGAFDFVRSTAPGESGFRFRPPSELPECIPSLGDFPPGPHRSEFYRRRCRD